MIKLEKSNILEIVTITPILLFILLIIAFLTKTVSLNFSLHILFMFPLVVVGILKCAMLGDIKQFDLKSGIFYGFLLGFVLSLISRIGVALNYFILAENKDFSVLPKIFLDYWVAHLAFAAFGAVCIYLRMKIHIKKVS